MKIEKQKPSDRGGFQNRDVGRSDLNYDLGPDYGFDFATYARPMTGEDILLQERIETLLRELQVTAPEVTFHAGLAFIRGEVQDQQQRGQVEQQVLKMDGVDTVINLLSSREIS